MENYFELLCISPSPHLDHTELENQYKSRAAELHPDQGGDEHAFHLLHTAYKALKAPSSRIEQLLKIHAIEYNKRGTVSNHLMNFFMSTGALIQRADAFIKMKQQASSPLTKALLEPQSLLIQEQISEQIDQLEAAQNETLVGIPATLDKDTYTTAARDLAFLEKWQAQLRSRYASLF